METRDLLIIAAAVVILAALLLIVWLTGRRRRTNRLRERFGPEYDRAVEEHHGRRQAEGRLSDLEERRRGVRLRPLPDDVRRRHYEEWQLVQNRFVDQPIEALKDADELLTRVLAERGYPAGDFSAQADMVAVDHPQAVGGFRDAHALVMRSLEGDVTTEQLRRAMVDYRDLFGAVVGEAPERDTAFGRPGNGRHRAGPGSGAGAHGTG
jgi:hypothetical protein